MTELSRTRGDNFQMHSVAFGDGADVSNIEAMANAAGPTGKFHAANIGELVETFSAIASGSTPSDRLFAEIGTKISSAVSDKLVLDFL